MKKQNLGMMLMLSVISGTAGYAVDMESKDAKQQFMDDMISYFKLELKESSELRRMMIEEDIKNNKFNPVRLQELKEENKRLDLDQKIQEFNFEKNEKIDREMREMIIPSDIIKEWMILNKKKELLYDPALLNDFQSEENLNYISFERRKTVNKMRELENQYQGLLTSRRTAGEKLTKEEEDVLANKANLGILWKAE